MKKVIAGIIGMVLIALALIPTPDDVTVISPLVQFGVGIALIRSAFLDKE